MMHAEVVQQQPQEQVQKMAGVDDQSNKEKGYDPDVVTGTPVVQTGLLPQMHLPPAG
jgi:hypothetical protein